MYKLEFTLKQHTPLIHFQHNQAGATLRATEVKPKLDKFIIDNLAQKNKQISPKWIVGRVERNDGGIPLDYKIKIEANGERQDFAISSNPNSKKDIERTKLLQQLISAEYINKTQYFADNQFIDKVNQYSEIRKGVLYDHVLIHFFSFVPDLIELIRELFPSFIVSQNFGTRHTKGFGCFSIEGESDNQILKDLKAVPGITGIFRINSKNTFQQKLQFVAENYSLLKRGKTFGGYQKSKLWEVFCSTNQVSWEKKKIKLHIKSNDPDLFEQLKYETNIHRIEDSSRMDNQEDFKYIRALLGLAEHYEFVLNDKSRLKVAIKDKLHKSTQTKEYAIDRFQSPIRYFITEESIFLITEEINPLIHTYYDSKGIAHNREFEFTIDSLRRNKSFTLEVPKQFSLPEFIQNKGDFGPNLK